MKEKRGLAGKYTAYGTLAKGLRAAISQEKIKWLHATAAATDIRGKVGKEYGDREAFTKRQQAILTNRINRLQGLGPALAVRLSGMTDEQQLYSLLASHIKKAFSQPVSVYEAENED